MKQPNKSRTDPPLQDGNNNCDWCAKHKATSSINVKGIGRLNVCGGCRHDIVMENKDA